MQVKVGNSVLVVVEFERRSFISAIWELQEEGP
jgi:hypothetical protein